VKRETRQRLDDVLTTVLLLLWFVFAVFLPDIFALNG